jgi:hypothetical protein
MLCDWLVRFILAWAWHFISLWRFWSSTDSIVRTLGFWSRIILTRSWKHISLSWYYVGSLSGTYLICNYSIFDYISITLIISWAWNIIAYFILSFTSYRERFGIFTKILSICVISRSWQWHLFFTDESCSLATIIHVKWRIFMFRHRLIRLVLAWPWHFISLGRIWSSTYSVIWAVISHRWLVLSGSRW